MHAAGLGVIMSVAGIWLYCRLHIRCILRYATAGVAFIGMLYFGSMYVVLAQVDRPKTATEQRFSDSIDEINRTIEGIQASRVDGKTEVYKRMDQIDEHLNKVDERELADHDNISRILSVGGSIMGVVGLMVMLQGWLAKKKP